jgi:catechol 2,3-dioxygenase-like lactoylglutathione lyase family enzyme
MTVSLTAATKEALKLPLTAPTLLVSDVARSREFYRDKVGLTLYRTNEGFANFKTDCAILALWQADYFERAVGCKVAAPPDNTQRIILACELASPDLVDRHYERMSHNGVSFLGAPKAYAWNVYAAYFRDPDNYLWEIFAWQEGGPAAGGHEVHHTAS